MFSLSNARPSDVQTFVTPYFFWASPNNWIREDVKLSVSNNLFTFHFPFIHKDFFSNRMRANLTIVGRDMLSFLFGFPSLWLLSRSSSSISMSSFSKNVFIRISLVFSSLLSLAPYKTRQFRRGYYSKSSMLDEMLWCLSCKCRMVFSNWLKFSSFFLISFSRSPNFCWHKFKWFSHFNLGFLSEAATGGVL